MRALILDMDGTMIDSERTQIKLWDEAAREHGCVFSFEIMASTVGTTHEDTEAIVHGAYPDAPHEAIHRTSSARYKKLRAEGGVPVKAGLMELLAAADERGIPVGVCTSTRRPLVEETLGALGLLDRLSALVCGGEAARGKPDPAPYLLAAERLGAEPAECLVVEDSPPGARSALDAGMQVVVVPDVVPIPEDVSQRVRVYKDLTEVVTLL